MRLLQFTSSTWAAYGGHNYAPNAGQASRSAQIAVAQKVLAGQGPGAWPVCSQRAGLTRGAGGSPAPVVARSTYRSAPYRAPAPSSSLAVDGILGPLTTAALQRWVGTHPDGVLGPRTARALARKVGAPQRNIVNSETIRQLQATLQVSRHARLDGVTVKALQRSLNK